MLIETGSINKVHRDPLFDRTLAELRSKGGYAAVAAAKAEEFLSSLSENTRGCGRDKFRFTRKGEYRIRNCRKVDLGCGYRIVCIQKDQRLVLLYVGTHDDCFRWIERHRTAEYDLDGVEEGAWIELRQAPMSAGSDSDERCADDRYAEEYEASLMERVDDTVLRRIFSGLTERR